MSTRTCARPTGVETECARGRLWRSRRYRLHPVRRAGGACGLIPCVVSDSKRWRTQLILPPCGCAACGELKC